MINILACVHTRISPTLQIDNIYPTKQFTAQEQEVDDCNIGDPSIVCAKKAEPGVLIKGMQDWIYRDPQGEIQGMST